MHKRLLALFVSLVCLCKLSSTPILLTEGAWEAQETMTNFFGYRNYLKCNGIHILPIVFFDLNWPAAGGIKPSKYPKYQFVFDLQGGFDSYPLLCYKGGSLFIDFQIHQGQNVSAQNVGDFQGFDNLEARNFVQLAQLWYQQTFIKERFMITFGKIDIAPIFAYTPFAQTLLNNSYTQMPTILGYPTYPDPAVGVIASFTIKNRSTLKLSLFDGSNALGVKTGQKGANLFFNNLKNHAFISGEWDFDWTLFQAKRKGGVGLGIWSLIADVPTLSGGTMRNTVGAYFFSYQTFFKEIEKPCNKNHQMELGGFAQLGVANKKVCPAKVYLGKGLTLNNLVKKFVKDSLSVGMATVIFSNTSGVNYDKRFEMSLEATYQFHVLEWCYIQPDFQWIIHPGGTDNRNALVATIRFVASI